MDEKFKKQLLDLYKNKTVKKYHHLDIIMDQAKSLIKDLLYFKEQYQKYVHFRIESNRIGERLKNAGLINEVEEIILKNPVAENEIDGDLGEFSDILRDEFNKKKQLFGEEYQKFVFSLIREFSVILERLKRNVHFPEVLTELEVEDDDFVDVMIELTDRKKKYED